MTLSVFLLILGFFLLIKGADWLVNGSVSLAKYYRVSELVIGLTIVAFGTSAPELVVNIISSVKGYNDVTLGNVVGSNLFNVMFIVGVSGLVQPIAVQVKTVWNEIPFSVFTVFVLLVVSNMFFNTGEALFIDRIEGVILLLLFILFIVYIFTNLQKEKEELEVGYKVLRPVYSILYIIIGLVCLVYGSRLVIDNALLIAQKNNISEKIIGITIVSAGTSLPELFTSAVAAFRKKSDIAMGNIIGSNIFNILLVLGVSTVIRPIRFNTSFNVEIILLIIATLCLFAFMFSGKRHKLDRWEAAFFLIGFIGYIMWLLYQR